MPYTNVWTTAAPLDTQAANQGAVDFRATKLDIMQRVQSFGAGVLASRPTPETTSASADWTGVMYWATDTKQAFRWNGSSWDDISASLPVNTVGFSNVIKNVTPNTITNPAVATTIMSVTIPANTLAIGSIVKISAGAHSAGGADAPAVFLNFGGTNFIIGPIPAALNSSGVFTGVVIVKAGAVETGYATLTTPSTSISNCAPSGLSGDITTNIVVSIGVSADPAMSVTGDYIFVEILK